MFVNKQQFYVITVQWL